jgi:tRNA (uracil-5-)-methyltransferase
MNDVSNVEVVLADSRKFSKRMLAGKFQDASGHRILLDDFSVVLVDPPRAGLDPDTLALVSRVDHILYVSCGPENLLKNIREGLRSHVVEQLIVLDHFPNTRHVEVAVYMRRCP